MVKTRAQRSDSTINTPSPVALPTKTKKRKSVIKSTDTEESQHLQQTVTEKLEDSTPSRKTPRKDITTLKSKSKEKRKSPKESGKKRKIKNKKIDENAEIETTDEEEEGVEEQEESDEQESCLDTKKDSDVLTEGNKITKSKKSNSEDNVSSTQTTEDSRTETAQSQSEVPMETDSSSSSSDDDDDDDDDDAPEDVSFHKSKHDALELMSQAMQETKKQRDKVKEKRKAREDLYAQQKKQKLQHVRLPDDFIQEVTKEEKIAEEENKLLQQGSKKKHVHFDGDDEYDVQHPEKEDVTHSLGMTIVALPKQIKKPKPKSQTAIDFLKQRLWGSEIKRQSVNEQHAKLNKKHGRPASNFLTKKGLKKKKKKKKSKQNKRNWSSLL
ncbi:uncharacterized protein LOC144451445 [Glandiceps talaboti]